MVRIAREDRVNQSCRSRSPGLSRSICWLAWTRLESVKKPNDYCTSCWTCKYPVPPEDEMDKLALEKRYCVPG